MGMTATQIEALGKTRERTYTVEIRAPAAGFILTRNISPGQRFESGDELYVIGDLGRVWILADVFEHEARWLRAGSHSASSTRDRTFSAVVSNVLPTFDEEARTMKFRLDLANPSFRFRPGMFVDVEFPCSLDSTLTVPATPWWIRAAEDRVRRPRQRLLRARQVETGWRLGDRIEVSRV